MAQTIEKLKQQLNSAEKLIAEQQTVIDHARERMQELDSINEEHQLANYELIGVINAIREELLRGLVVYAVVAHDKGMDSDMCLGVFTSLESAHECMQSSLLGNEGLSREEINAAVHAGEYSSATWTLAICETTVKGV